jgi:hypothetical protein
MRNRLRQSDYMSPVPKRRQPGKASQGAADRPVPRAERRNGEKDDAAMDAAMTDTASFRSLPRPVARMMAVEILLAEPEALGDDVLESCLYILREKLRTK